MTLSHRSRAADPAIALPSAEEASRATVDGALRLIAERAVGLSAASADDERGCGLILLTRGGRRITSVGTDALAERLSALYDEHCENPCRAAWHGRTTIRAAAPGDGECQHAWMSEASRLGARSILCAAMVTGDRLLGTITVHSSRVGAFSPADEDRLRAYANAAAVLIDEIQAVRAAAHAALRAGA